jgi:hypothetical protein
MRGAGAGLVVLLFAVHSGASLWVAPGRVLNDRRHRPVRLSARAERRPVVRLDIDLGQSGEPKGVSTINFVPLLPDSEIFVMRLGLPLGMLIEVVEDGGSSIAGTWFQNTRVVIKDALPGYSACKSVQKGDLLRAVSAYRTVVVAPGGFSAWRQLTSYTPVGEVQLRRLIFKTEGASYDDVRDAIKSHNEGDRIATLVIERAREPSAIPGAGRGRGGPR